MESDATPSDFSIPASDGYALAATRFEPPGGPAPGRPVVLINSALAVRRQYYAKFAGFLAEQGPTVVTYDYRGIGDSAPRGCAGSPPACAIGRSLT